MTKGYFFFQLHQHVVFFFLFVQGQPASIKRLYKKFLILYKNWQMDMAGNNNRSDVYTPNHLNLSSHCAAFDVYITVEINWKYLGYLTSHSFHVAINVYINPVWCCGQPEILDFYPKCPTFSFFYILNVYWLENKPMSIKLQTIKFRARTIINIFPYLIQRYNPTALLRRRRKLTELHLSFRI